VRLHVKPLQKYTAPTCTASHHIDIHLALFCDAVIKSSYMYIDDLHDAIAYISHCQQPPKDDLSAHRSFLPISTCAAPPYSSRSRLCSPMLSTSSVLSSPAENQSGTSSSDTPPKTVGSSGCQFGSCPAGSPATGFNASDTKLNVCLMV
jgi:hypothetical protein